MTNSIKDSANFIQKYEQIKHGDADDKDKGRISFDAVEDGLQMEMVDKLLKMKNGILTSIKLPLDNESVSDCLIPFRLLSSREHDEIMDEMNKLKYIKNVDTQYNSYLISKMLSKASSDNPSSTPKLSELSLRSTLTRDMLLATGIRYNEFVQQTSPHIEWLTEEDIKHFIEDINSQEDITKKFDILNGLSLKQTQGVLLNLLNKLETITKQLDKFVTGS